MIVVLILAFVILNLFYLNCSTKQVDNYVIFQKSICSVKGKRYNIRSVVLSLHRNQHAAMILKVYMHI